MTTFCSSILEYYISFTFRPINKIVWSDNFTPNEEWQVIRVNHLKIIEKAYCDKSPYNDPKVDFDIALYSKTRWYCLNTDKNEGTVITFNKDNISIPNLIIETRNVRPHVMCCRFKFDMQILLTLILKKDGFETLELKNKTFDDKIVVMVDDMHIEVLNSIIKYKGLHKEKFNSICKNLYKEYYDYEKSILEIYNRIGVEPNYISYESIAPLTWHKGKRENQRGWPDIHVGEIENGVEFPKGSGIYYTGKYVGLSKRSDDNPELYIPKIFNTDHLNNKNSILYRYINGVKIINNDILPNTIGLKRDSSKDVDINEVKTIEIDFKGDVVYGDINPEYIIYKNIVIRRFNDEYNLPDISPDVQILDKNNNIAFIIIKNEMKPYKGYRIKGVTTLPWYYKQIVHDYNKLGRLKKGPIMDLMHIGVVDEHGNDVITFPFEGELYVSPCLETHRLCTFKYAPNVIIRNKRK